MANLPKTFKAAVVEAANTPLVLKDLPLVPPKRGEVLVRVLASGVCHSDADILAGHMPNKFPIIPGHEVIGDVAAVGEGEDSWKVGDRVGAPWHGGHDGTCRNCRRGMYQACDNEAINGVTRNGGWAEYVLLRTEAVVHVPREVDPAAYAPILCAGVTVFNSIRKMKITTGSVVAVQGLGGLGHLAVQYAARMGYRVVALSSGPGKEKFAKELGAHEYVDSSSQDAVKILQGLGGAALVVATAPNTKIMGPLLPGLEVGGKLLILSPAGEVSLNTLPMIMKGLSVHGWPSGASLDSEEAIDFARLHDVNCLVEKFPLADAQKAVDHMMSGKVRFRSVLTMG